MQGGGSRGGHLEQGVERLDVFKQGGILFSSVFEPDDPFDRRKIGKNLGRDLRLQAGLGVAEGQFAQFATTGQGRIARFPFPVLQDIAARFPVEKK